MTFPVMKSAGYVLVNTPDMIVSAGSTFTTEKILNPDSDLFKDANDHIRSYEEFVNYLPNQVYIGNERPEALEGKMQGDPASFTNLEYKDGKEEGKFGAIVSQGEFFCLLKYADEFDLVYLSEDFVNEYKAKVEERFPELEHNFGKLKGADISKGQDLVDQDKAMGLYMQGDLVGYVRQAHDTDENLSAHNMLENLVSKASGALAAIETLRACEDLSVSDIDYVIECSEEAAGDINQRGGGNIAKAIAEMVGCGNASGSDVRSFCAAPVHALVSASGLVKAGIFKNVLVVAGGSTAKLGMNARDHMKIGLPILEDAVGGFGVIISENDGKSPIMRTDIVGKHNVNTGSSPQAVMSSLVADPLERAGLNMTDVDKYSPEMQNPDITKNAGAGDVPEANYKMIAALAVMKKQIERSDLASFVEKVGMVGWAPTQGHIPSAVPYCGHMIDDLTEGDYNRAMLVGKGSLFLGRLTNLFDGISIVAERNSGEVGKTEGGADTDAVREVIAEAMKKVANEILTSEE